MNKSYSTIKYLAYCRKSTEDSSRQIASIEDQKNVISDIAKRENLYIVGKPLTEEKSAKTPGRPIFNEMLERIEKGDANAILCWDIDRLYRNPVDEGRVRWMLQNEKIKIIRTPYRQFYPVDAGLLMGVEGGRATDYIIQLSKNIKRAFERKIKEGWRPAGPVPIGYIRVGDPGAKTIAPDPKRFKLVRKMWDLFLTGNYSPSQIRDISEYKWGLRTRPTRKMGGKPLSLSNVYKTFNDPFYSGWFYIIDKDSGEKIWHKGKHIPMVTEKEYKRGQELLGYPLKPQPKKRRFAFTGLIKCDECSSSITAEEKNQVICSECKNKFSYNNKVSCPKCDTQISAMKNPKYLRYVYYRCTKKKNKNCSQRPIKEEELEKQFDDWLTRIDIDEEYLQLALDYLKEKQKTKQKEEKMMRESLHQAYKNCESRIDNLNKVFSSPQNSNYEIYTPEEFKKLKKGQLNEKQRLEDELKQIKNDIDRINQLSKRIFIFCTYARHHFKYGDIQTKREIFSAISSNLTLKAKKLRIKPLKPYLLIEKSLYLLKSQNPELEPINNGFNKGQNAIYHLPIPSIWGYWEAIRTWIQENQHKFHVPELKKPSAKKAA